MSAHHDQLEFAVHAYYQQLPVTRVFAEYVWIDGALDVRSKTKVVDAVPQAPADLPEWNFDGSSTGQAPGHDSEVLLRPVRLFADPFRGAPHVLVMCDCYLPDGRPAKNNNRAWAAKIFAAAPDAKPWYGIEQEYTMFADARTPLGWPRGGFPGPQGPYYCSAGADVAYGRHVVEAHIRACVFAGIGVSGLNGEVMPGQWEYQVGPVEGIAAADQLWISRYLLKRVAEQFNVIVSFAPKPIVGDWNGAGCHTNFSTAPMRADGGYAAIVEAIERLGAKHAEHIAVYGEDNHKRLTGRHETASMHTFSWGVANRGASIRVPRQTERDGRGYLEDRRPASNMDPYLVTAKILATSLALPEPANEAAGEVAH